MSGIPVILLVEDDLNDEMLTIRGLKNANTVCHIDVARDGLEALNYLFNPEIPCPDLVLLDLKLPKVSGIEILRRIRSETKTQRLPVVVLSSSNEVFDLDGCFDAGANSFIRKAVDYDEYMDKIIKLAHYWLTVNEVYHPKAAHLAPLS